MPCPSTGPKLKTFSLRWFQNQKKSPKKKTPSIKKSLSQTVLFRSKLIVPDQKLNRILCHSKTFCDGTKTEFTAWKSYFGMAQIVWDLQKDKALGI